MIKLSEGAAYNSLGQLFSATQHASVIIMWNIKSCFIYVFLLCFSNIEGTGDGYRYYDNLQARLKVHHEPTDWQTARIKCHDEDAILAAPWNDHFWSRLLEEVLTPDSAEIMPTTIYAGVQERFPEGVYKNENGKQILSRDWRDTIDLARCVVYHSNGTRELVNCQLPFAYICHAPATAVKLECGSSDYELNNDTGSCYKFHKNCKPWDEAYKTCQEEGAHLAIINSDKEAKALVEIFAKYPFEVLNGTNPAWGVMAVGFYYWKEADIYITIDGSTLEEAGYARWSSGNPSSRGLSPYGGGMFRSGLLDDVDKSYRVPFVCEKKIVQHKTNTVLNDSTY